MAFIISRHISTNFKFRIWAAKTSREILDFRNTFQYTFRPAKISIETASECKKIQKTIDDVTHHTQF
jgi:hypothetical protein